MFVDMHVDPARITAGHEAGARRGADGAGRIKVSEPHAFPGHLVKDGRSVLLGSEGPDVGIAKVIAEDDNDIRFPFGGLNERGKNEKGKEREKIDDFHKRGEGRKVSHEGCRRQEVNRRGKSELLVAPLHNPWVFRALLHGFEFGLIMSENSGERRVLCEITGLGRIG